MHERAVAQIRSDLEGYPLESISVAGTMLEYMHILRLESWMLPLV